MNTTIGTLIGAAVWVVCQGLGVMAFISAYEALRGFMRWLAQRDFWNRG